MAEITQTIRDRATLLAGYTNDQIAKILGDEEQFSIMCKHIRTVAAVVADMPLPEKTPAPEEPPAKKAGKKAS